MSGSGGIAPPFSTSSLYGGEWPVSCPGRFIPGEIVPGTHCIGRVVDPRAVMDAVEKRKILPCRESNSGRPACNRRFSFFISLLGLVDKIIRMTDTLFYTLQKISYKLHNFLTCLTTYF
jgi:hypothetical protein